MERDGFANAIAMTYWLGLRPYQIFRWALHFVSFPPSTRYSDIRLGHFYVAIQFTSGIALVVLFVLLEKQATQDYLQPLQLYMLH